MRDDSVKRGAGAKWEHPKGEPFFEGIPTIAQYCTDFWWEDQKKPRTPCKLSLVFFDGAVMLTMNDEEKRRSTNTTAQTVRDALELLEGHLSSGTAPWRSWGKPGR